MNLFKGLKGAFTLPRNINSLADVMTFKNQVDEVLTFVHKKALKLRKAIDELTVMIESSEITPHEFGRYLMKLNDEFAVIVYVIKNLQNSYTDGERMKELVSSVRSLSDGL